MNGFSFEDDPHAAIRALVAAPQTLLPLVQCIVASADIDACEKHAASALLAGLGRVLASDPAAVIRLRLAALGVVNGAT